MFGTVVIKVPKNLDDSNSSLYGWIFSQDWNEITNEDLKLMKKVSKHRKKVGNKN